MKSLFTPLPYFWTLPNSLLGGLIGTCAMIAGTRAQWVDGVLEFYGGPIDCLLRKAPITGGALALTLGHVVWGRTKEALELTRDHERVHVQQYAHWGPFFLPAYAIASILAWWRGESAYRGNCFEKQAFDEAPVRRR